MSFFTALAARVGFRSGRLLHDALKVLEANFAKIEPGVTDAGTSVADYTLVLTDYGKPVLRARATAQTLTVPTNASVAFPIGTQIPVIQTGAGALTIQGAGGVTINQRSFYTAVAAGRYARVMLTKVAANVWNLSGDLTAA